MKNGFTLIELLLVILIIGILSVTAAPKFISMKTEAVIASLEGMKGALKSGATMVYAKAILKNQAQGEQVLVLDSGVSIRVNYGYPEAKFKSAIRYVVNLDNIENTPSGSAICTSDWCGRGAQTAINTDANISLSINAQAAKIWPRNYAWDDKCGVHYINNRDGSEPIIGISTSEC